MAVVNKFCRLCLTENGVKTNLFEDATSDCDTPMSEKVMRCVPVQIEMGDGLPALLCKKCTTLVDKIWTFRAQSEHVDSSLRKLLQDIHATNDWEEKIKSIAKESPPVAPRPRQCKKKEKLEKPLSSVLTESRNDIPDEAVENTEPDPQPNFDDDWPLSGFSPEAPSSPQSLSGKEDEYLPLSKSKRKRLEYACEFCGRKFTRSNHLAQHELTHTAEKPFQCSDCGKSFWYKASLIGHIKQTHTGDVNYTCDLCGKGFFKKTELTRHKPTHSNETPHKCPQCGMGFKITKTLKRHIRNVHNAQRSHVCHTCGKSFIQLQTLKVHMVLHSGVKPYTCSYCGKGFAQSAPLKTHIRIHTGEKPYSCHVCQAAFSTRTALTSHSFKHKNVLPYPCTRCEKSFRLKKDLTQHEQGHNDEEVRLKQCPEIKVEKPDAMDQIPDPLELPQDSQVINQFERVVSNNTVLFQTFQETNHADSQPLSSGYAVGGQSNSMLPQLFTVHQTNL